MTMVDLMSPEEPDTSEEAITHAGLAVQAADTGRVLLIQRSMDPGDPPEVQGTWEFPGGGLEEGEDAQTAAMREFMEETGLPIPEGEVTGGWRSPDGIYQGYVHTTPVEAGAFPELNPDLAAAELANPDDPERRNPDVSAWFTIEQILNLGPALRPEVYDTDWSQFAGGDMSETATEPEVDELVDPDDHEDGDGGMGPDQYTGYVPFHGVACVENHRSGDGRGMRNLRRRPLPQAGSWQKVSAPGHNGSVVVMRTDQMVRVGQEIRVAGVILPTPEGDEFVGLVAHFPRFGVSIDADSTDITFAYQDEETGTDWYENGRIASQSALPIPAFAEAWLSLGEAPEGFLDGEELDEDVWDNEQQALVASAGIEYMAAAVETYKRGPGWVTNPEDTRRLHAYWTKKGQEGYNKVGWGRPGDFNRCRLLVGEELTKHSPDTLRFLNQICAQWHYDALGFWPGRAPSEQLAAEPTVVAGAGLEPFHLVERDEAALVASAAGFCAPAEWFEDPQFSTSDGRMVQDIEGNWGAPVQVTEGGQVFGHIAKWTTCHTGNPGGPGICTAAPRSSTNYAYFLLGQVLTTEGMIPCGSLTVGGGHADLRLGIRAAMAHYDSTSSVWANVNVGEDEYGIWCAGWVPPGITPEKVIEARAAKLSGDWRPVGRYGEYELMAALSVNMPGFPVPRIHVAAGLQTALVAAGVVDGRVIGEPIAPTPDIDQLAERVALAIERRQTDKVETAALMERFADVGAAETAALVARFGNGG